MEELSVAGAPNLQSRVYNRLDEIIIFDQLLTTSSSKVQLQVDDEQNVLGTAWK